MKPTLACAVPAVAFLLLCACSGSSLSPDDAGAASIDASALDASFHDAGSLDSSFPAFTVDAGPEGGSSPILPVCAPLPGCASALSCPAGDGCNTCQCDAPDWLCLIVSCTGDGGSALDGGADADGGDADASGAVDAGAGLCPLETPVVGAACTGRSDIACRYNAFCPPMAYVCVNGAWALATVQPVICPP